MSRNLVICCDGTNNQFGSKNTNVVRIVQAIAIDGDDQLFFYDPGVGTMPEPGFVTRLGKSFSQTLDLAIGTSLMRNVEQAYAFVMQKWRPGDRVFLFGFSRGAYTVRVLAAIFHQLGLLTPDNQSLLPYATKLFQGIHKLPKEKVAHGGKTYWDLCDEFRRSFGRMVPPEPDSTEFEQQRLLDRRFPVHFLGVWDTVSSVGWVWEPHAYPYTVKNPSVRIARHAVAIDERRWFFRRNPVKPLNAEDGVQNLEERWFPGVHADVGGGYGPDGGALWRTPFSWVLREAVRYGLRVNADRLRTTLRQPPMPARPWLDRPNESLKGAWKIAEYIPKKHWVEKDRCKKLQIGAGRRYRTVPDGAIIDRSALLKIRDCEYSPKAFSQPFLDAVRGLDEVPAFLEYRSDGTLRQ